MASSSRASGWGPRTTRLSLGSPSFHHLAWLSDNTFQRCSPTVLDWGIHAQSRELPGLLTPVQHSHHWPRLPPVTLLGRDVLGDNFQDTGAMYSPCLRTPRVPFANTPGKKAASLPGRPLAAYSSGEAAPVVYFSLPCVPGNGRAANKQACDSTRRLKSRPGLRCARLCTNSLGFSPAQGLCAGQGLWVNFMLLTTISN